MMARMSWTVDPVQALEKLSSGIRNKAMRIALNAAAAPVKAAVIASAPQQLGHLKAATKIKIKNYDKGATWTAIVGASSKFKRTRRLKGGGIKKRINKAGKKVNAYIRPAVYQHFANAGNKRMRGRHYLEAAFQRSVRNFQQIARAKLREVIEGELMKG